jgi:hypothetical protein
MSRALLVISLTAMATADFTTTMDFRDWLIGEESIGRSDAFGFQGSIVNIDQNRTTVHVEFDQDSGDLATKYNPNNTNSLTSTFAPDYISAQIAKPLARETTYDVDCSRTGSTADTTCTVSLWGLNFYDDHCADSAFGVSQTSSGQGCQNGTQSNTWTDSPELMTAQRKLGAFDELTPNVKVIFEA